MIAEVGHKYTVTESIILEEVEPKSGDVVELYWECDREITPGEAARVVFETAKIKETYSNSVIHYVGVDTRRITVQYSVAPPGGEATPLNWWQIAIIIGALITAIIVAVYLLGRAGYLPWVAPTGNVSVIAISAYDDAAIAAPFTFNGEEYTTPITIEDLDVGTYHITWLPVEGYLLPDPPTDVVTIIADETVEARGEYWPEDAPPRPTTGLLIVATYPVRGTVYVDGADYGKAPLELTIEKGDHTVSFGDVSGYEAPQARGVTIHVGGRTTVIGEYKRVWPTWAWAAIAVAIGAGVVGIAAAVTKLVRRR